MKILLVDDEEAIVRVLADFLVDCGHETGAAPNGAEALKQMEAASGIDLVLSDIRMPSVDGIDLLKAVRVRHPGVPVVLMTGHGDESLAIEALHEGAHGYLKKPIKLDELLTVVEQLEERKHLEFEVLEEYKKRSSTGKEIDIAEVSSARITQVLSCLKSAHHDLGSVADLCNDLCAWGHKVVASHVGVGGDAVFILDELPGLLASIDGELDRIEHLVARGAHGSR